MITVETLNENYIEKTGQKPPTYLTDKWEWQDIIWNKVEFEAKVFNLQKRIYKATKAGQLKQAKALSKLLLRSSCSIILNVRRITQNNSGKKTAGIDGACISILLFNYLYLIYEQHKNKHNIAIFLMIRVVAVSKVTW